MPDKTREMVCALVLLSLLGGCAPLQAGDPFNTRSLDTNALVVAPAASAPRGEQPLTSCADLAGAMEVDIKGLALLKKKMQAQATELPQTVEELFARTLGDGVSPASKTYARDRARADTTNQALRDKGCQPFDIDERIAQVLAAPPPPTSVPQRKK